MIIKNFLNRKDVFLIRLADGMSTYRLTLIDPSSFKRKEKIYYREAYGEWVEGEYFNGDEEEYYDDEFDIVYYLGKLAKYDINKLNLTNIEKNVLREINRLIVLIKRRKLDIINEETGDFEYIIDKLFRFINKYPKEFLIILLKVSLVAKNEIYYLFRKLIYNIPDLLFDYLNYFKHQYDNSEGSPHKNLIIQQLNEFFYIIKSEDYIIKNNIWIKIIRKLKRDFPNLRLQDIQNILEFLPIPNFREFSDFYKFIIHPNMEIRRKFALYEDSAIEPQFKVLFFDYNKEVRKTVTLNPASIRYKTEFTKLFFDEEAEFRKSLLYNPKAVDFMEFQSLFYERFSNIDYRKICLNKNIVEIKYYIDNSGLEGLTYFLDNKLCSSYIKFASFFRLRNGIILRKLASMPEACAYDEYRIFFKMKDRKIIKKVARNPNAPKFEEYKKLFEHDNYEIRLEAAKNPNSANFIEFKQLFLDPSFEVRRAALFNDNADKYAEFIPDWYFPKELGEDPYMIAADLEAVHYEEYKKLFADPSTEILKLVALNEAATKLEEYKLLFKNESIKEYIAINPEAVQLEEYSSLFHDNVRIRRAVASNPKAVFHPLYKELFKDKNVKYKIAANPLATLLPMYKSLLSDKQVLYWGGLDNNYYAKLKYKDFFEYFKDEETALYNPFTKDDYPEFKLRFHAYDLKTILKDIKDGAKNPVWSFFPEFIENKDFFNYHSIYNPVAHRFDGFRKIFSYNLDYIKRAASMEEAARFEEFKRFFREINRSRSILEALAGNRGATRFKEFAVLFDSKYISYTRADLALNPKATKFDEFRNLFFIKYISKYLALNPNAIRFDEYNQLFFVNDFITLKRLARNESAAGLECFRNLYNSRYWSVRDALYRNKRAREHYPKEHAKLIPRELGNTISEIISNPKAREYEEYERLFDDEDPNLMAALASSEEFAKDKRIINLFRFSEHDGIMKALASNKEFKKSSFYEWLFYINSKVVLLELAEQADIFKYKNAKRLFSSYYESVRGKIASRGDAVDYEEYKKLFKDESARVRRAVALNERATRLKEYEGLFEDSSLDVIKGILSNPSARKLKVFSKLYFNSNYEIRNYLAGLSESLNFAEFKRMLLDKNWHIRRKAMRLSGVADKFADTCKKLFPNQWLEEYIENEINIKAKEEGYYEEYFPIIFRGESEAYEEFKMLFTDELEEIRLLMASHPSISKYKEASAMFRDPSVQVRQKIAANEEAVKLDGYELLFDDVAEVRKFVASNIEAVKFPQFKKLFNDKDPNVRRRVAVNWNAVEFEEYKKLFEDKNRKVKIWILKNREAKRKYPEKYEELRGNLFKQIFGS
ncbi:MAG: hypothetical protein ACTSRZ_16235 [Promethearchaeota archaeon]